jgi:hypothetical protein
MSGKEESENQYVNDKIKSVHEQVDALEKIYGLNSVTPSTEIDDILNFSWNELEALTPNECMQHYYVVNQYLLKLRLSINRYKSLRHFCLNALNLVFASEYKQYKVDFSWADITKYSIIKGNEYAKVLNKYIQEYDINIQSFDGIVESVTKIGDTFKNMSYTKKQEE